jgi:excisionase family DNA binding protein
VTAALPAGDLRILDWLTASEAAVMLSRDLGVRFSVDKVRALAASGELERVPFGSLVRVSRESVAAFEQRQAEAKAP